MVKENIQNDLIKSIYIFTDNITGLKITLRELEQYFDVNILTSVGGEKRCYGNRWKSHHS